MKKILVVFSVLAFVTNVANARLVSEEKKSISKTEMYISVKGGIGLADEYWGKTKRNSGRLAGELASSVGVDWKLNDRGWLHSRLEGEIGYTYFETYDNISNKSVTAFGNAFLDFGGARFSEYIGVGIGYELYNYESCLTRDGVLGALYTGVAYNYSEKTVIDFGLRYMRDLVEDNYGINFVYKDARLGLRFKI